MDRLTVALDAWAVIAYLNDEPAAEAVEKAIVAGGAVVSWINLGEVMYVESRRRGDEAAETAVRSFAAGVAAELPDRDLLIEAARIKAGGGLSYADCFAVATAERHGVPLMTGDPEIAALDRDLDLIDLR